MTLSLYASPKVEKLIKLHPELSRLDEYLIQWNCEIDPRGIRFTGYEKDGQNVRLSEEERKKPENKDNRYKCDKGSKREAFVAKGSDELPFYHPDSVLRDLYDLDMSKLFIVEGEKKALILIKNGFCAIAIAGVELGLTPKKDGDRVLKPSIVRAIEAMPDAIKIPMFDADTKRKPLVFLAHKRFSTELLRKTNKVLIGTCIWDEKEGKGVDDFIDGKGIEEFRKRLENLVTLDEFIEEYEPDQELTHIEAGTKIAEILKDICKYNADMQTWLQYSVVTDGVWSKVNEESIVAKVETTLLEHQIKTKLQRDSDVVSIFNTVKRRLLDDKWEPTPSNLIPFKNGIYNTNTNELIPHSPDNKLTWCLPRDYSPVANDWGLIESFFKQSLGDKEHDIEILNCFAAAVLRRMGWLQIFLCLMGLPGSGKGTFSNLLAELIDQRNMKVSEMSTFCGNQFDAAGAYQKGLLLFPDQQPYSGNIGTFLNATGGEYLRYERKGKDSTQFIFEGLTLVTSNQPVFTGKNLKAIQRRQVLVEFNRTASKSDPHLLDKLKSQLEAWTNYLLSIPVERIESVLKGKNATQKTTDWRAYCLSSSVASWINDHLIKVNDCNLPVGNNKNECSTDQSPNEAKTAFGSYHAYCRDTGLQAMSLQTFSHEVATILSQTLNWGDFDSIKKKTPRGMVFVGVTLRGNDEQTPTVDELLGCRPECRPNADLDADLKPLLCKDSADLADLDTNSSTSEKKEPPSLDEISLSPPLTDVEESPSEPARSAHLPCSKGFESASRSASEPASRSASGTSDEVTPKVGDIVRLTTDYCPLSSGHILEIQSFQSGFTICIDPATKKNHPSYGRTYNLKPHNYEVVNE